MTVDVTSDDISFGERGSSTRNPVALAFSRAYEVPVSVYCERSLGGDFVASYRIKGAELDTISTLPHVAQIFMRWWGYGPGNRNFAPHPQWLKHIQPFTMTDEVVNG